MCLSCNHTHHWQTLSQGRRREEREEEGVGWGDRRGEGRGAGGKKGEARREEERGERRNGEERREDNSSQSTGQWLWQLFLPCWLTVLVNNSLLMHNIQMPRCDIHFQGRGLVEGWSRRRVKVPIGNTRILNHLLGWSHQTTICYQY